MIFSNVWLFLAQKRRALVIFCQTFNSWMVSGTFALDDENHVFLSIVIRQPNKCVTRIGLPHIASGFSIGFSWEVITSSENPMQKPHVICGKPTRVLHKLGSVFIHRFQCYCHHIFYFIIIPDSFLLTFLPPSRRCVLSKFDGDRLSNLVPLKT